MSLPIKRGDAQDVVIELSLNYDGLEYLVNTLEGTQVKFARPDRFVEELRDYLNEVDHLRSLNEYD